jgi:hypothetical protein
MRKHDTFYEKYRADIGLRIQDMPGPNSPPFEAREPLVK